MTLKNGIPYTGRLEICDIQSEQCGYSNSKREEEKALTYAYVNGSVSVCVSAHKSKNLKIIGTIYNFLFAPCSSNLLTRPTNPLVLKNHRFTFCIKYFIHSVRMYGILRLSKGVTTLIIISDNYYSPLFL